ncbi:ATP-binding protein [Spirosoma sp. SC4-14]|uniref:sensor histidine kinase n=1 Tax=Spirosoma sp. SC4-14 TaxID=3128900 RepID=UPI0030D2D67A
MRFIFGLYILIGGMTLPAVQAQPTANVLTIPLEEVLPDEYWRFHAGHNPAWASPSYDDRQWTASSPSELLLQNQPLWQARQGWFRLPIRVGKHLVGQELHLSIDQFGTSEWYLDGRKLATLKPFARGWAASQRTLQSLSLQLADTNQHLLAVHYRFQPEPIYYAATGETPFETTVYLASQASHLMANWHRLITSLTFCLISVFALLGLLHLLFYRANPNQVVNKWQGMAMLCLGFGSLLDGMSEFPISLTAYSLTSLICELTCYLGFGFLLTAVYRYLNQPVGWLYRALIIWMAGSFIYSLWVDNPSSLLTTVLLLTFLFDYVRVSWLGKRQPTADARLPWNALKVAFYTLLGSPLVLILLLVIGQTDHLDLFVYVTLLLVAVAMLIIPLGFSLSLVRDYARTHQALRQNLRQVEQLSRQTLVQEQEKQYLLAQQNQTLERQVHQRTAALEESLEELRRTQNQLIQAEKMATMGKLTKGIVDRILNPLNYVNNFSLNAQELLVDLQAVTQKHQATFSADDRDSLNDITSMLIQNLTKINEHGNSTARILQDMRKLLKERSSTLVLTDLNPYLRQHIDTALQKAMARYPALSVQLDLQLCPQVIPVHLLPVEFSEMLASLVDNTCYALAEKSRRLEEFEPRLEVSTEVVDEHVQLQVRDNGHGIPTREASQLFNPFFTTKPTAKGTGLGLFMSKDVVEYLQGQMQIESVEEQYTQVTILLPLRNNRLSAA